MFNGLFMLGLTAYAAPYIAGFMVQTFLGSYQQQVAAPPIKRRKIVCLACERKLRITGREVLCPQCQKSA